MAGAKSTRDPSPAKAGGSAKKDGNKTRRDGSPAKKDGAKTKRDGSPAKKGGKDASSKKTKKTKAEADAEAKAEADALAEAEAAEEEAAGGKKRRRPKPETLKTITTGAVAVVDFVEDDPAEEEPPASSPTQGKAMAKTPEASAPAASDEVPPDGGDTPKQKWGCEKWLREVDSLVGCISTALCTDEEGQQLEDEQALAHCRALESQEELLERIRSNGCLEKLCAAIWPKLMILKEGPATASELAKQWGGEGAGDLLFGGLPSFFGGLEPRIGSPDPKVMKDMIADHCSKPDSQIEFTTGNYSVVTTSEVEWKFVVEPETPYKWPIEERLMNDEAHRDHMRKLLPTEILMRRMDAQNLKLKEIGLDGDDLLTWNEVCGGRMYTGPMFVKYNTILRGLDSPVDFLKNSMIQLCCPKDVSERFMGDAKVWQPASGTLPYEKARKEINLYTTTIHVINSCIVKMGKLTVAVPVYRGMSGRIFPGQFWSPDRAGVMGGVEFAFMSTTPDRAVAEQYSQDGFGIIVEIEQGMIDRGAEIAWLSQYPHEVEVLFAPLAGLQATEMRIDTHPLNGKHIIVVKMRVSINLTNPTIEAVVAKRRKICSDMGKGLLMEMRSFLNKKGSSETDAYLRLMEGLMAERPLRHEATWYNDDPCFQEAVNETLRLKREVMNVPTLETKKLEGDAVAQLLGETLATKPKVLFIPDTTFREFKQLKVLNLDGFGGIKRLPTTIGLLQDLHTLHMRECETLEYLPQSIGKLRKLSTLNMTSCKELIELPKELGQLTSLTSLDLGFCRALTALPVEMGKLNQLQTLKLQQCSGLVELPSSLGQLAALKVLTLYGCSALTQIPDSLGNLPELQEFNLRACSAITSLPPTFGTNLPSLTMLDLTLCKGLTALPESLGRLRSLQTLFLGNCFNILEFPPSLTNIKTLTTLNLYNCGGFKSLPDTLDNLESLTVLSLQGCEKLVEVPESLSRCLTLTTLTLWNCNVLERLPDLSQIPKLQIDGVPEQLADWEKEQKQKRLEDAKDGKNKGGPVKAEKTSGWAAVKKGHSLAGTAAAEAGKWKTREQLATARGEGDKTARGGKTPRPGGSNSNSPDKGEAPAAQPAGGDS